MRRARDAVPRLPASPAGAPRMPYPTVHSLLLKADKGNGHAREAAATCPAGQPPGSRSAVGLAPICPRKWSCTTRAPAAVASSESGVWKGKPIPRPGSFVARLHTDTQRTTKLYLGKEVAGERRIEMPTNRGAALRPCMSDGPASDLQVRTLYREEDTPLRLIGAGRPPLSPALPRREPYRVARSFEFAHPRISPELRRPAALALTARFDDVLETIAGPLM
ncbi:hypothetical protein PSPO01_00369 [Paraphaeosphaeria sporulosa]